MGMVTLGVKMERKLLALINQSSAGFCWYFLSGNDKDMFIGRMISGHLVPLPFE